MLKRYVIFLLLVLYDLIQDNCVRCINSTQCAEEFLKKNPEFRKRFSTNEMEYLCTKQASWTKAAAGNRQRSVPKPGSNEKKQDDWFQSLFTCRGDKCIFDVLKCSGAECQRSKPLQPLPRGVSGAVPKLPVKQSGPFPAYHVGVKDIIQFNVSDTDSEILNSESDDVESCEKRMWLSNVCFAALHSNNSADAFLEQLINDNRAKQKDTVKKDLQNQYKKFQTKCDEIDNSLTKHGKTFNNVTGCADITKFATVNKKTALEKCEQVLGANTPIEAFPELKHNITTTYAQNLLAREYGQWLTWCRSEKDQLTKQNQTLHNFTHSHSPVKDPKYEGRWSQPLITQLYSQLAYRQEIRMLTDAQRERFFWVLNYMKKSVFEGGASQYDILAKHHDTAQSPGAHFGSGFLPFHRHYLSGVELAIRKIDSSVALPYWDSTLDDGLPNAKDSIIWTSDFFGNGDGVVTSGPFANWPTTVECPGVPGMKTLYRKIGSQSTNLYRESAVKDFSAYSSYDQLTWCVNPYFELAHGTPHNFVGGFMADTPPASNDPVFYMHHCFIDSLWEDFRQKRQSYAERESSYPDVSVCDNCKNVWPGIDATDSCKQMHKRNDTMQPFAIKNIDGLSNEYTSKLFYYQPRPTCSAASPYCYSPYLFCDSKKYNYRCLSKVKINGTCTGFEGTEICYKGKCVNGICTEA